MSAKAKLLETKNTISVKKMEIEIDLAKSFGQKVPARLKDTIGQAIIDDIITRTQSNKSLEGGKFKQYSEKYAEKKKVPRNKVDLTLTSDMLDSLDVKNASGSKIKIFVSEPNRVPVAYNHQVGDTLPKRSFLGVRQKEMDAIVKEFKSDLGKNEAKLTKSAQTEVDRLLELISNGGLSIKTTKFGL